jgi:hypothetical protein
MSNTNITEEVDKLVNGLFTFVNKKGASNIEETIDCIRQARACFEDRDEILGGLSRTNFGDNNRVRDFFVKDYDFFRKSSITIDWMYDFLNCEKDTSNILQVGKYVNFDGICKTLDNLNSDRLYSIKPRGDIGSGEYLVRLLFLLLDEACEPTPLGKGKVCGDMLFRDKVFEVKGQWGRLDGVDNKKIVEIIKQHPELNVGKQVTVCSKNNKKLVQDLLKCYYEGDNPYTIISVDKPGYVIIDENLEWDDDVDVRVRIPKWMIKKVFNENMEVFDG